MRPSNQICTPKSTSLHDLRYNASIKHLTNFLWVILLFFPSFGYAKITKENVSNALLQEFYSKKQKPKDVFQMENKDTDGMHIESLSFALGEQTYKLVFFDDGKFELSSGQKGDLSLQEILSSTVNQYTPQQIINLISGMQQKTPTAKAYQKDKDEVDSEEKRVSDASNALRWSKLIDRAASGQSMRVSTSQDQGFDQSVSAARMMNQCQGNQKSGSPQRNAAQNVAEALVLANASMSKANDEGFLDKSKEYQKRGNYSFFDEVDQFNHASPERAFQLLQKTRTTEYEIFQSSLQKSNVDSHDPYFLAANRNFMFLVRTIGKDKTLKLMDDGMKKIALQVERFVEFRKILPASAIIYDRKKDKYYIDPTLNQPSEARYLLSLVCLYEWKNQDKNFQRQLNELNKENPSKSQIKDLFLLYKDFLKTTSHPRFE